MNFLRQRQKKKVIPARIREARQYMELSQSKLALFFNVPEEEVQRWEDGRSTPSEGQVFALAAFTPYSHEWFYEE